MKSKHWQTLFIWTEVVGLFVLIGGSFLFLQYNNVSSLCPAHDALDPCHKFQLRSDAGLALMALGALAIASGFVFGWFHEWRRRRS
jgi:hypothetical protein